MSKASSMPMLTRTFFKSYFASSLNRGRPTWTSTSSIMSERVHSAKFSYVSNFSSWGWRHETSQCLVPLLQVQLGVQTEVLPSPVRLYCPLLRWGERWACWAPSLCKASPGSVKRSILTKTSNKPTCSCWTLIKFTKTWKPYVYNNEKLSGKTQNTKPLANTGLADLPGSWLQRWRSRGT